jgi:hypothetical protein
MTECKIYLTKAVQKSYYQARLEVGVILSRRKQRLRKLGWHACRAGQGAARTEGSRCRFGPLGKVHSLFGQAAQSAEDPADRALLLFPQLRL